MLLREHPIGDIDKETINIQVITHTLSNDWGFWRTVTGNLKLLHEMVEHYHGLAGLIDEDRRVVHIRIEELEKQIETAPKSLRWKTRAAVGEKVRWYKVVEELSR
jgi:hypothetical protein